METKLHTSLVALKVQMLKIPPTIIKKIGTTLDERLIICVSFVNKGKPQVGRAITVRQRA